jgi:hypothetical protein
VITLIELRASIDNIVYPAFVDIKFDGELNTLRISESDGIPELLFENKYGNVRNALNYRCIADYLPNLMKFKGTTLIGELFYGEGKAGALYDLLSHRKDSGLNFRAFDIFNGVDGFTLLERKRVLCDTIPALCVPNVVANSKQEAMNSYLECVLKGYEGVVVKPCNDRAACVGTMLWAKIKNKDSNVYEVSMVDPTRERIEIVCKYPDKAISVGVKVVNRVKHTLQRGDKVLIEHQGILKSGSLRHPVFKGFVERTKSTSGVTLLKH